MIQVFQYPSFASLMISRSCAVSQNLSSQQCAHLIKNTTFRCWISKTILKYIQRSQKVCQCTHRYAVHYTDYTVTILYTNKWEVLKYWRKGYRQWQRQSLPPLRAQPIDHMSDGQAYGFSWHQAEVESFSVCIRFSTLNILIYIYLYILILNLLKTSVPTMYQTAHNSWQPELTQRNRPGLPDKLPG